MPSRYLVLQATNQRGPGRRLRLPQQMLNLGPRRGPSPTGSRAHLIGLGEVVACLGQGFADRFQRLARPPKTSPMGTKPCLRFIALFSHAPQTRQ